MSISRQYRVLSPLTYYSISIQGYQCIVFNFLNSYYSVSVLQEKKAFLWYMYFFSFLVFGPAEDEKEDHQCLGHWSECKFKLVPIVCNHSGGGGHRTKKENSVVSFCISVPALLPVYVRLHSIYC